MSAPRQRADVRAVRASAPRVYGRAEWVARPSTQPVPSAQPVPSGQAISRPALGQRIWSVAILFLCGLMVLGLSLPSNLFAAPTAVADETEEIDVVAQPVQDFAVGAAVQDASAARDEFGATSWAQLVRDSYGPLSYDYTVGSTGPIRWPFPVPVDITDGFGYRSSNCGACSSNHQGVDFIPGAGAPILAVADGVVTHRDDYHWSYGVTVEIEHKINGQTVTTKYAHMQPGSVSLQVGDRVKVWDQVGKVGNTGVSTGPHLHLEVWINGEKVNPFTWLKLNASA